MKRLGRWPAVLCGALLVASGLAARVHRVPDWPNSDGAAATGEGAPTRTKVRTALHIVSTDEFQDCPEIALCRAQDELLPEPSSAGIPGDACDGAKDCGSACLGRIDGVDCAMGDGCGEPSWKQWGPIPWQHLGQGEYIGPPRNPDVPVYLVRVDDLVEFRYVATRFQSGKQYRLQAGDELKIESLVDPNLNRTVTVQPDGSITLLLLDQVEAARLTVQELTSLLKERYKEYYKIFDLTVTPVKTNTRLDDLLAAVNNRFTAGGQGQQVRVAADGTISLTKLGKVPSQGLSLDELAAEVNARYAEYVEGLEVTPILVQRAPHYVYVLGDVKNGGRFRMDRPTTVMQALAIANGANNCGNLRQVVVFRRAEDWRLIATRLDIRGAVYGKRPTPADEIFLRDSDIVLVPKACTTWRDDFLELIMPTAFTAHDRCSAQSGFSSAAPPSSALRRPQEFPEFW